MLFQWTSRWHVHYTSLHMQLNICNAVNSSWLESPQFICCCTNLYMSWTKFSRTKFNGLKDIICCRWWKASKNYQACQISKGNWCCVDSYSKVEGPFCKWLFIPSNPRNILCNCRQLLITRNNLWIFLLACLVQWTTQKCCVYLQFIKMLH